MSDIPHAINVYTDGSYKKGDSGSGIFVSYPNGAEKSISPHGLRDSTVNRAELRACIEAFKFLQKDANSNDISYVCVHSDSQYVVENYYKVVTGSWYGEPWKTKGGDDFANKDLWQEFSREFRKVNKRIEIYKIKGHSGNLGNNRADALAESSRTGAKKDDLGSKKGLTRGWLDIPVNKIETISSRTLVVYIAWIKSDRNDFVSGVQIIRPRKYLGKKVRLKGKISNGMFHCGHFYFVRVHKGDSKVMSLQEIIRDIGRPSENLSLWKHNL